MHVLCRHVREAGLERVLPLCHRHRRDLGRLTVAGAGGGIVAGLGGGVYGVGVGVGVGVGAAGVTGAIAPHTEGFARGTRAPHGGGNLAAPAGLCPAGAIFKLAVPGVAMMRAAVFPRCAQ